MLSLASHAFHFLAPEHILCHIEPWPHEVSCMSPLRNLWIDLVTCYCCDQIHFFKLLTCTFERWMESIWKTQLLWNLLPSQHCSRHGHLKIGTYITGKITVFWCMCGCSPKHDNKNWKVQKTMTKGEATLSSLWHCEAGVCLFVMKASCQNDDTCMFKASCALSHWEADNSMVHKEWLAPL